MKIPQTFAFLIRSLMIALLLVAPRASFAADSSEELMKQLIERVSAQLDTLYKAKRIEDRAALEQLIRTEIVPHIDQKRLTQRVFRQFWPQVVEAKREDDAQQRVINSLVRTYTVALSSYSGDTLSVINVNEDGKKGQARTRIRRPNGQIIEVDFSLGNRGGVWMITDMAVDGIVVSLTLFNSVKPIWEQQGIDAALNAISEGDASAAGDNSAKSPR